MADLTLGEVINGLFEGRASRMNTSLPGVVIGVRDGTGVFLDVQPAIDLLAETGETLPRAPILNVPAMMPMSSTGGLQFEINVGDPILLVFSQRGLDTWKAGVGKPNAPRDGRMFDPRDCFAIPCVFPSKATPANPNKHTNPHSAKDVVIVHNIGKANEVEIRLKKSGDVYIKTVGQVLVDSGTAVVNASTATVNAETTVNGNTTINGNLTVSGTTTAPTISATTSLKIAGTEMNNHRHTGVEAGPSISGGPI